MTYKHYLFGDTKTTLFEINFDTKHTKLSIEDAEQCVKLSYNSNLDQIEKDLKDIIHSIERWRNNKDKNEKTTKK